MIVKRDKFIDICNLTTSVLGLKKGSLYYKSRKRHLVRARGIAAVIGKKEEGISLAVIAKVLRRDRLAVYHYNKVHEEKYTSPNDDAYRIAYNKVYSMYYSLENSKETFQDMYMMKEYLKRNGVKESSKNEVNIFLRSGKVGCTIKTSYLDFSNQMENIKLALINYNWYIHEINLTK
jgi:hypothetical protein